MLFRDNPVLTRELLVTLRSPRAFILQLLYICALGALVYFYWPAGEGSAHQAKAAEARRLFDIFFLGQFFLVALMAPTFAAGSITGEKERKTYEFLLVSDLTSREILLGKFLGRLVFLLGVMVAGLPVLAITQLYGGVSLKFLLIGYVVTAATVVMHAALSAASAAAVDTYRGALFRGYGFVALHLIIGGVHPALSPAAWIVVLLAVALVAALVWESKEALGRFGLSFLYHSHWDPVTGKFGALPFVYGTLVSSVLALLIAVPLSLGAAIFLAELAPGWIRPPIAFLIEMLAAVPSVVYGLWGIFVLVPWLRDWVQPVLGGWLGFLPLFQGPPYGIGMLAAGVILAIMVVPYITSVSREVLLAVPASQREAWRSLSSHGCLLVRRAAGRLLRFTYSSAHASSSRRSKAMPCTPIRTSVSAGRTSRLKRLRSIPR